MSFLLVAGLSKSYTVADRRLEILRELGLSVERGEMVAVMGASGVGKSTLLHLLGGLDRPDTGSIAVGEHHVTTMADRDRNCASARATSSGRWHCSRAFPARRRCRRWRTLSAWR